MFEDYGWLVWLGVAIVLGAIEAATVDFVFVMFAGGALGGSVAAALGAPFPLQVVVAVVVALLLLLGVARPWPRASSAPAEGDHQIGHRRATSAARPAC